jgi:ABC-type nitrate/sulfonate/bicarbonate transport system permease component
MAITESIAAENEIATATVTASNGVRWQGLIRPIVSLAVLLIAWELVGRFVLTNPLFFAPLSRVVLAAIELLQTGQLQNDILVSFSELIYGMALAIVIGIVFGTMSGISQRVTDYTKIYVTALYATPLVAVAPLLILWLGIGAASKVAVVFLTAVFPILINTAAGVRSTDATYVEVAQSFGASRFQVIGKVIMPSTFPYMLTGIRIAIGRGIVGVVVGELFGARAGLGYLIFTSGQTFDVPALFVGVIALAFFGVTLTFLAELIERRALRWRRSIPGQ